MARKDSKSELEVKADQAAVRYLEAMGYDIIEQNWTCDFGGIDIIARDTEDGTIVFADVTLSCVIEDGFAPELVTPGKRASLELIAASFLKDFADKTDRKVRFDIVGLLILGEDRAMVKHHVNAFGPAI